jgi:DNA primase
MEVLPVSRHGIPAPLDERGPASAMNGPTRLDAPAIRLAHPLAEVAARYGVALSRRGALLMGCCPLHEDRTPSFLVDERDQHFHCFGCGAHGDVIDLVRQLEGLDFRGAIARLEGERSASSPARARVHLRDVTAITDPPDDPAGLACLAAAVELYRNQLCASPEALAYLEGRGLRRATLERWRLGYAAGDTLLPYLRWRRLPIGAARRIGLFDRAGNERMAGRVVLPALRHGRPRWLIGRSIAAAANGPKYLGLPGPKPLLGWDAAQDAAAVVVVEGVMDLLILAQWGVPAVALAGTHASAAHLAALRRAERVYLALDADAAGQAAAVVLAKALHPHSRLVTLPGGVNDVADLALRPTGCASFLRALREAALPAAA